jgi:hypothetical protein
VCACARTAKFGPLMIELSGLCVCVCTNREVGVPHDRAVMAVCGCVGGGMFVCVNVCVCMRL